MLGIAPPAPLFLQPKPVIALIVTISEPDRNGRDSLVLGKPRFKLFLVLARD